MEVTDQLIEKIARLARLEFNEAEKPQIREDLQKMIAFVEKLAELSLDHVEPLRHVGTEMNIFREDEVFGQLSREEALKNAPLHDNRFFKVPRMFKK